MSPSPSVKETPSRADQGKWRMLTGLLDAYYNLAS